MGIIKKTAKLILSGHLVAWVALSSLFSASCFRSREKRQYIEPLGMYFLLQAGRETVTVAFGEKNGPEYPNFFETGRNKEMCGSPLYFMVDNTSGCPKIKYILFARQSFFDIHVPDYPYSVEKNSFITDKEDCSDYLKGCPKIKTNIPNAVYPPYYAVWVQPSSYDKLLEYWVYDLGEIDDLDSFIEQFVKTPNYMSYSDLIRDNVALGYNENVSACGDPKESKRVAVTDDSRKELTLGGWLFLDTMDIKQAPVLEMDKWEVDSLILSVIYRIDARGERIPVNGARYVRWMDMHDWRVFYQ